ncbi:MAG: hypothetical protein AB4041_00635 [Microcystaceae cyanobacterium]
MSENPLDKFDRESLEESSNSGWLSRVVDSFFNRPSKREYDRIVAESLTSRKNLKDQTSELETLRSENQRLSFELNSVKRESWLILIFSTASSISIAYGVNLVSGNLNLGWGLFLIILGVTFAVLAWILKLK